MQKSDMQRGVSKTIDITVQAAKITEQVLKNAMEEFLNGKAEKTGNISMQQLEKRANGNKLESIEVTDNNIRDFLTTAKKYDVDFSLKRDKSTDPPTYHVFFQSDKAENFNRAFTEYASGKKKQLSAEKTPYDRQKLNVKAQQIANQPREHKEKIRERSKENSL